MTIYKGRIVMDHKCNFVAEIVTSDTKVKSLEELPTLLEMGWRVTKDGAVRALGKRFRKECKEKEAAILKLEMEFEER